jgi:carbonic anhydrase/acetyltransferase-like protein (isoleucine patch superfamily)
MPIYTLKDRQPLFESAEWYVAPTAAIIGSVTVGHQANVWFNVVVRADNEAISIGRRTNVQDGSVLHADPGKPLVLGENVTIGHKVMLHGCLVGDGALIGMNAVLLNGAKVGAGSIVGAGSLLAENKEIPPGVLALGSPARVIRPLTQDEKDNLAMIAEGYVRRAERYRAELAPFQGS